MTKGQMISEIGKKSTNIQKFEAEISSLDDFNTHYIFPLKEAIREFAENMVIIMTVLK